ncbi:MAG TPA: glycolate oxidase subunit GlcE [Burkholderiales bacterium]
MNTDHFSQAIRTAAETGKPLRIRGGDSKDFYGQALAGDVLDTRGYAGIVDYEPTELVITARCGTPLAAIEAELARHKQMLAFEPPHFGADATVGGMVASGIAGPRRAAQGLYYGSVRDHVLGVKLMNGEGEALAFGGTVMKNVAGYDVSRVIAGSLGTLGLILDVSLKVLPCPVASRSLRLALNEAMALSKLCEWGGQPLPIGASAWHDGELCLRLEGADAAVKSAAARLGGEAVPQAEADTYWQGLREQTDGFFAGDAPLWRLSVPATAPAITLPGKELIEWGGAQRWFKTGAPEAALRAAAKQAGGHATLFRAGHAGKDMLSVFTPLEPVQARLQRNLKQAFDPRGIFNPGRLYREF